MIQLKELKTFFPGYSSFRETTQAPCSQETQQSVLCQTSQPFLDSNNQLSQIFLRVLPSAVPCPSLRFSFCFLLFFSLCLYFLSCTCVHTATEPPLKTTPSALHPSMQLRILISSTHFHLGPCFGWRALLLQPANLMKELMASHLKWRLDASPKYI